MVPRDGQHPEGLVQEQERVLPPSVEPFNTNEDAFSLEQYDASDLSVLISAGGRGTRLWPLSTDEKPKQFCALYGELTLLQEAYQRARLFVPAERVFVSIADSQQIWVQQQLPTLCPSRMIVEPEGRNTAPALAFAASYIKKVMGSGSGRMIVFAADQVFQDEELFRKAMQEAIVAADKEEHLVSVGVLPTEPNTHYGYMECGDLLSQSEDTLQGLAYIEKPDRTTAEALVAAGSYLWNTNIFVWKIDTLLRAYRYYQPDDAAVLERITQALAEEEGESQWASDYRQFKKLSIDHAVMENVAPGDPFQHVFVRGRFGWADVGNFDALAEFLPMDVYDNRVRGDVEVEQTTGCVLLAGPSERLVVRGCRNIVVVASEGNVLLMPRGQSAAIKELLSLPLHTNLAHDGERFRAVALDKNNNLRRSFVRLSNVQHSSFSNHSQGVICASNVSQVRVTVEGSLVIVEQLERAIGEMATLSSSATIASTSPQVRVFEGYKDMSSWVASSLVEELRSLLQQRDMVNLILSAGRTPLGLFDVLRTSYLTAIDWSRIRLFQMDDYVGLPPHHPCSMAYSIHHEVVQPLGIRDVWWLNNEQGELACPLEELEASLEECGGVDVIVHGVGTNGHLGFNEPGSAPNSRARIVNLAPSTLQSNFASFGRLEDVPPRAITLGLMTLLSAKRSYLMASGSHKAEAIHRAILGPLGTECPASFLTWMPGTMVAIDRAACRWIGARLQNEESGL